MSVSVKTPAKPTPKKKRPTLRTRLDDALADAAGLEADLEDEQKKVAELEAQLNSLSSGVEYASEYKKHDDKRNAEMNNIRGRLKRRDEKIAKLEADKLKQDDHIAELEEKIARGYRLAVGLESAVDRYVKELDEANDKIAEQAQKIVGMRDEAARFYEANVELGTAILDANAESAHNAQAARLLTENVDALEQALESKHWSMMEVITARGERIDALDLEVETLREENARLKAAEYLHKRPSYVRGAISAINAIGRLVANRGGER